MSVSPKEYNPSDWVVIHIKGDDTHYRIISSGSSGSDWSVSDPIVFCKEITEDLKHHFVEFTVKNGSIYKCQKEKYGITKNIDHVWRACLYQHGEDRVELVKADLAWSNIIWNGQT